jgi:hypothetical protein
VISLMGLVWLLILRFSHVVGSLCRVGWSGKSSLLTGP